MDASWLMQRLQFSALSASTRSGSSAAGLESALAAGALDLTIGALLVALCPRRSRRGQRWIGVGGEEWERRRLFSDG